MIRRASRVLGFGLLAACSGEGTFSDEGGDKLGSVETPSELKQALSAPATDAYDFLIQDVCVMNGVATAADPYGCTGTRRNLNVNELLRYRRITDHVPGAPGGRLEISDSYPVVGPHGGVRVVHTFNIATMSWPGNRRSFLDFDTPPLTQLYSDPTGAPMPHSDGYEVSEADGAWVSLVGTRDAQGVAPFFNAACGHDDSWISFPTVVPAEGSGGYIEARATHLRVPFEPKTQMSYGCPAVGERGAGTFFLRGRWTFNSNKVLETIITSHYDRPSPDESTAMERIFYTREYGRTRWEAWQKPTEGEVAPTPDTSCTGPAYDLGFVRTTCREFTRVVADPVGGFEPRSWPVHQFMARGNLLLNHGFAMGDVSGWGAFAPAELGVDTERFAATDLRDGNRYARLRRGGPGASIYQDVPRPAHVGDGQGMTFGVRAWTDASTVQQIRVGVFQLTAGAPIFSSAVLKVDKTRRRIAGGFVIAPGVTGFRFQIYVDSSERVLLDDAWLTPL